MKFLRNIAVQEQAVAADGIATFELGPNPLSVLLLCLRPLNDTGTLAEFESYRGICAALNRVSVLFNGTPIVSMRGEDLAVLNFYRHGILPLQATHADTNDDRRCVVLPILLGRNPFDLQSCFPEAPRGQLQLECDFDIADTGYDGLRFSCESIELPGAKPKEYEKKVQVIQTNAATGTTDIDLPCTGNAVRGILLFGTTGFTGAAPAPSWGRIQVLLDNMVEGYAAADWEAIVADYCLYGRQPPIYDAHDHRVTTSGCAQAELTTIGGPFAIGTDRANQGWQRYAYLDYDPLRNDMFNIDTSKKTRLMIRSDAEAADLVRAIPIEVIRV